MRRRRDVIKALGLLGAATALGALSTRRVEALAADPFTISRYSGIVPASVMVFRDGDYAVAVDGKTKEVVARSVDHAEVLQAAINQVIDKKGGRILIKSGVYNLDKTISLEGARNLIIEGEAPSSYHEPGGGARLVSSASPAILIPTLNDPPTENIFIRDLCIAGETGNEEIGIDVKFVSGGIYAFHLDNVFILRFRKCLRFLNQGGSWGSNSITRCFIKPTHGGLDYAIVFNGMADIGIMNTRLFGRVKFERGSVVEEPPTTAAETNDRIWFVNCKFETGGATPAPSAIHVTTGRNISICFLQCMFELYDNAIMLESSDEHGAYVAALRVTNCPGFRYMKFIPSSAQAAALNFRADGYRDEPGWGGIRIYRPAGSGEFTLDLGKPLYNAGTATISAGETRVTVEHGLAYSPSRVLVTPIGDPGDRFWVENVGSSSFDIVVATAPTSDIKFYWKAEV